MNGLLFEPKQSTAYNICGKSSICDYCNVNYNDIGKCGKKKIKRHGLSNDIAVNAKN